jgi:Phage protein Gp138 N-terminal domain
MTLDLKLVVRHLRDEQASNVEEQATATAIDGALRHARTAMPGIIDSFDAEKQTVSVKPAIKAIHAPDDGTDPEWKEMPLIVDVPIYFPGTAEFALTFPIKQGDECLLVICDRSIDLWHEKGDVQEFDDMRHHHTSDAIAFVGLRSKPNVLSDYDEDNVQLRTADGDVAITIDKDGVITLAAGDSTVVTIDDQNALITAKATTIKLDGDVHITGALTGDKGATFHDDVTASGSTVHQHKHSGVTAGGAQTGPPVPGTE